MTGIDFTSTNNIFYGDRRVVGAYVYISLDEPPFVQRHTVFEYEKPIVNLALNQPSFGQYTSTSSNGPLSMTDGTFDTYQSQGNGNYTSRVGVKFADENGNSVQKQWNRVRFYTSAYVSSSNFNKTMLWMKTQPFERYKMNDSTYSSSGGFDKYWTFLSSSPTKITGVVAPNGKTYTVLEFSMSIPRQSYGVMIENNQTSTSNITIHEIEVFYDE